ncbi:MAG TPA: hypothetical protein VIU63_07395 [Nitrospira sp.]
MRSCAQFNRGFLLGAWLIALAGCSTLTDGSPTVSAQTALVGKTKAQLLACAGTPLMEGADGERIFFVYYREASTLEESFGGSKSSFAKVHHGCRATIVFEKDQVNEVRYENDPPSYHDEEHCEEIFDPCINP